MKLSTLMLTAALAVSSIASVSAADTQRPGMKQHSMKHQQEGRRHSPIKRLLADIELTSEQKEQIKQLLQQHRADNKTERTDTRAQLHALMLADSFDEVQARQLLVQQQQAGLERQLSRIRLQHQVLQLLTEEQREQVKVNAEKRKPRGARVG